MTPVPSFRSASCSVSRSSSTTGLPRPSMRRSSVAATRRSGLVLHAVGNACGELEDKHARVGMIDDVQGWQTAFELTDELVAESRVRAGIDEDHCRPLQLVARTGVRCLVLTCRDVRLRHENRYQGQVSEIDPLANRDSRSPTGASSCSTAFPSNAPSTGSRFPPAFTPDSHGSGRRRRTPETEAPCDSAPS